MHLRLMPHLVLFNLVIKNNFYNLIRILIINLHPIYTYFTKNESSKWNEDTHLSIKSSENLIQSKSRYMI